MSCASCNGGGRAPTNLLQLARVERGEKIVAPEGTPCPDCAEERRLREELGVELQPDGSVLIPFGSKGFRLWAEIALRTGRP